MKLCIFFSGTGKPLFLSNYFTKKIVTFSKASKHIFSLRLFHGKIREIDFSRLLDKIDFTEKL